MSGKPPTLGGEGRSGHVIATLQAAWCNNGDIGAW